MQGSVTLLLLLAAFAGCLGSSNSDAGDSASASVSPEAPVAAEFSQTTGAIEGILTDDALLPVPNATVYLEESSKGGPVIANATTTTSGAFAFSFVEPGTYRLRIQATNYQESSTLVQVQSGAKTQVHLSLTSEPGKNPYTLLYIRNGIWRCSFAWVIQSQGCGFYGVSTDPVTGKNVAGFKYDVPVSHQVIVVETTWKDTSVSMDLAYGLRNQTSGYWESLAAHVGKPILRKDLRPGYKDPDVQFQRYRPVPDSNESFVLLTSNYYDGQYQQELNSTLYPVCQYALGYCVGVGITLDFRFEQYATVFVHQAPPDLETYTAIPDS